MPSPLVPPIKYSKYRYYNFAEPITIHSHWVKIIKVMAIQVNKEFFMYRGIDDSMLKW